MVALWLLVAAGGAVVLGKVRSGAADSRIHEATVREALEDRGIPEDLREGLHHHLDSVGSLWSALEGASWVIVSLGAFGLACEASSFLLTRKLLATEAMQEIARAER